MVLGDQDFHWTTRVIVDWSAQPPNYDIVTTRSINLPEIDEDWILTPNEMRLQADKNDDR